MCPATQYPCPRQPVTFRTIIGPLLTLLLPVLLTLVNASPALAATISTIVGNPTPTGAATNIAFTPQGVAMDTAGRVYLADTTSHVIRRIDPATGISTVVAGSGFSGNSGDGGAATSARLNNPSAVAIDASGNIFVADTNNHRIRKVDTQGTISTIAGTGVSGYAGDTGAATSARLNSPRGLAFDSGGRLYVADTANNRIRRVDTSGTITTVAGNGVGGYLTDRVAATGTRINAPRGVAVDSQGNLYIADTGNNRIRMVNTSGIISTFAGTGTASYNGDGITATTATLRAPQGVAVDASDTIYIADSANNRVRIVPTTGTINTVAGNGTADYAGDTGPATGASLNSPRAVALDGSGTVYIADTSNNRLRKVGSGTITTFAGNGNISSGGDGGAATNAQLTQPAATAFDSQGNLYIAELAGNLVRKVTPNGTITTVVGTGIAGFSGDGGAANSARLNAPASIAFDPSDNLYIADANNHRIRKVDTGGIITTYAGNGTGSFGGDGGPATAAQLFGPFGVVFNRGALYFSDSGNNRIRKVDGGGTISTVAGTATNGYSGDGGPATSANLHTPMPITADSAGNLYVGDYGNCVIRKIDTGGTITTVAGSTCGLSGDGGPATSAKLYAPRGVAIDSTGKLLVADAVGQAVRMVDSQGIITTVAGGSGNDGNPATSAQFNGPYSVTMYASQGFVVADGNNRRIRRVTYADAPGAPTGVSALAGDARATVSFQAPGSDGGGTITGYTVTSNPPGGTDSQSGSPNLSHLVTGLTNGVPYTFTVTASNIAGTGPASSASIAVTPMAPVDGSCGLAANAPAVFMPVTDLCATGTASAVSNTAPWAWTCTGLYQGSTAQCTAPTGQTASGSGATRITTTGGGWVVDLTGTTNGVPNTAGAIGLTGSPKSPSDPAPNGYTFPHGLYDFTLIGGSGPATLTITYPTPLPPGTVYWKYGKTSPGGSAHWYPFPSAVISADRLSITLTLTDGGLGDDDATANGVIMDAGGPGVLVGDLTVPTLSEWALLCMSLLLSLLGAGAVAQRSRRAR